MVISMSLKTMVNNHNYAYSFGIESYIYNDEYEYSYYIRNS